MRRKNRAEYLQYKERARTLAENRIAHYNKFYGCVINRVSIKNTRSRWGSCSKKGNLNFHYRIVLLSPELADYIIVHELCHLKELNHSRNFWKLVALAIPDYQELRKRIMNINVLDGRDLNLHYRDGEGLTYHSASATI